MLDIEPVSGTVTVGPREELTVDRITGSTRAGAARSRARWRARCSCAPTATSTAPHVTVVDGEVAIELLDPAYGIAPGQAAVIYDGTRVVGSATISATDRVAATA